MSFWIESHQSLARHRKLLRLSALLKCNRVKLIGHLHCLWWWGIDNVGAEGLLGNVTAAELAMAAEWTGNPDAFVEALLDAGFLDEEPFALHDWYEYAGKLMDRRATNKQRMKDARAEHVQSTNDARAEHVHPLPYQPTKPTKPTKPKEGIAPSAKTPKAKRPVVQLDEEFVEAMVEKYGRVFGGRAGVLERIEEAKAYKSYAGWTNKKVGVNKWLRNDADRVPSVNGVAHRPAVRTPEDVEIDKAVAEGFRSGRIKDGEPVKLGDLLRAKQLGASHG